MTDKLRQTEYSSGQSDKVTLAAPAERDGGEGNLPGDAATQYGKMVDDKIKVESWAGKVKAAEANEGCGPRASTV